MFLGLRAIDIVFGEADPPWNQPSLWNYTHLA